MPRGLENMKNYDILFAITFANRIADYAGYAANITVSYLSLYLANMPAAIFTMFTSDASMPPDQ